MGGKSQESDGWAMPPTALTHRQRQDSLPISAPFLALGSSLSKPADAALTATPRSYPPARHVVRRVTRIDLVLELADFSTKTWQRFINFRL